ncbi:DinB family protein [Chryseolinea lacunae]|uniref:DinB family protein n=1 Tax=Chryseolinea lacunae TaxID=2801331 RepID=A0ABS1KR48_9BACT|nr:DinB family protein [Chryseolinea lacunae]MBL0741722.1 DinB family protein [Chryseolinea lacunae]
MHPKLQKQFDRLQHEQQMLLQKLTSLPDAKLNASRDGKWSVNYIVNHLITAEQLSLAYMKKKSLGVATLKNSGALEDLKMVMLKVSQRLPFKYNAPRYLVQNTPATTSLPELAERWATARAELKNFLEPIDEKNLRKLIYKHPVAGMLDVLQSLEFMREHFDHHLPQIKRLL